jgi:transposase
MFFRQKHDIPIVKVSLEYFPTEELPYGEQAQIDFGHYNMRLVNGGERKKISFFAIVLSRSRMKCIWFWGKPYTARVVCEAHEKTFAFYEGIPQTVGYRS